MKEKTTNAVKIHHATKVGVWSYWPIASIYLVAILLALYTVQWQYYPDYKSHLMGWVLVLFGVVKVFDVVGFAVGFAKYDPLAKRSVVYAQVYPFLEITLGVLLILQLFSLPASLITLFIYSASLYGALHSLMKKEALHCACIGTYFKLPLSTVTVIEAVFMIVMSLWMLIMLNSMTIMVW